MNYWGTPGLVSKHAYGVDQSFVEGILPFATMVLVIVVQVAVLFVLYRILSFPVKAWKQSVIHRRAKRRAWRTTVDTPHIHLHGRFKVKRRYRRATPSKLEY